MENPLFERAKTAIMAELYKTRVLKRGDCSFSDEYNGIRITISVKAEGATLFASEVLPYRWIDGCVNWEGITISRLAHHLADQLL